VLASVHEAEPSSPLLDVHANVACERERARAVLDAARRRLADPDAAELVLVPASSTPRSLHLLAEERGASALVLGRSHRFGFARRVLPGATAERLLYGAPFPMEVGARSPCRGRGGSPSPTTTRPRADRARLGDRLRAALRGAARALARDRPDRPRAQPRALPRVPRLHPRHRGAHPRPRTRPGPARARGRHHRDRGRLRRATRRASGRTARGLRFARLRPRGAVLLGSTSRGLLEHARRPVVVVPPPTLTRERRATAAGTATESVTTTEHERGKGRMTGA
jgi:nucleotide-binding universal stress UspA family protein